MMGRLVAFGSGYWRNGAMTTRGGAFWEDGWGEGSGVGGVQALVISERQRTTDDCFGSTTFHARTRACMPGYRASVPHPFHSFSFPPISPIPSDRPLDGPPHDVQTVTDLPRSPFGRSSHTFSTLQITQRVMHGYDGAARGCCSPLGGAQCWLMKGNVDQRRGSASFWGWGMLNAGSTFCGRSYETGKGCRLVGAEGQVGRSSALWEWK